MQPIASTRILAIDPAAPAPAMIGEAAALIRAGQLVAFPTETVYGLGANAFDPEAVARIFQAKGRPATDPLIVHVASVEWLARIAIDIPPIAQRLIDQFWPGPLTLILSRAEQVASAVSAGLNTVAVRMPAHPVALALLNAADLPIAAPSANLFAHASPTTAQHVYDDLAGRVPLILDGGPTQIGVESTIVDLVSDPPRLLRPGGMALSALVEMMPNLQQVSRNLAPEDGAAPAPGMLLKHYSPHAELRLFDGSEAQVRAAIADSARVLLEQGKRVGLLIADEDRPALTALNIPSVALGSLHDLDGVARRLFAGLRDLDNFGVEIILARTYAPAGIGLAIRDRLLRAAEGRITQLP